MKVFLIIVSLLIVILVLLLVARIWLTVNTEKGLYRLSYGRMLSAGVIWSENSPRIRIWLLFFSFSIKPWQSSGQKKEPAFKRKNHSGSFKFPRAIRWFRAMVSSLHIDHFEADIDTGDYPLNAQLIPVAFLADYAGMRIRINFEERNSLDCMIRTRPIILLWNYITKNY